MKERLDRDASEVRLIDRPLRILAQEFLWEKEHNEFTGRENPEAFENFAKLWCAIGERSTLFQEVPYDGHEHLEYNNDLRKVIEARAVVMNKLNKITELLTDDHDIRGISARMAEAAQVAWALCSDDLPFLADSLQSARRQLGCE